MKTIKYTEKHTNASTIYADIDHSEKNILLTDLTRGFYDLLEKSNYDQEVRQALNTRNKAFRKHTEAGLGSHNSMASFLSGLLKQHHNNPNKDISTKMLEGIELCSQVMNYFDNTVNVVEFVKSSNRRQKNISNISELFDGF